MAPGTTDNPRNAGPDPENRSRVAPVPRRYADRRERGDVDRVAAERRHGLSATAEAAKTAIDRLTFFGDAVVAVAMTLLSLDLPVPDADSSAALAAFVGDHVGEYDAWAFAIWTLIPVFIVLVGRIRRQREARAGERS
jgi:hypothetical protein